jgi:hypothetical protein
MPNYTGLMNGAAPQSEFPESRKPAADIFTQFGIFTPSEKQAQAAQQQMYMRMLQQQQQMEQQKMAMAKAQMGTGYGFPMLTAMGGTRKPKEPKGMLGGGYQDQGSDEPSRILQDAIAEAGDEIEGAKMGGVRMLQLAKSKNDPDLAKIAINVITKARQMEMERAKDVTGIESTQETTKGNAQERRLKAAQAGNPGSPFDMRDPSGNLNTMRDFKDEEGRVVGTEKLGGGPVRQTNQTLDDPRTAAGKNEDYKEFRTYVENSDATVSKIRDIKKGLKSGAAQGWGASAVTLVDNLKGALGQFTGTATLTSTAEAALKGKATEFDKWASKTNVNASLWGDVVSSLAKTYNPTGTITEKDIDRAAAVVGKNLSNPAAAIDVLDEVTKQTHASVDRKYRYLPPDAKSASDYQYKAYKNSTRDWVSSPPKSKAEYDEIPAGTEYYNPTLKKNVTKRG